MDDNRAEGLARTVGGKLQDAAGGLIGDSPTKARVKANQSAGKAQSMYRQAADEVRDSIADQPFVALLSALGLGAVVGFLTTRR